MHKKRLYAPKVLPAPRPRLDFFPFYVLYFNKIGSVFCGKEKHAPKHHDDQRRYTRCTTATCEKICASYSKYAQDIIELAKMASKSDIINPKLYEKYDVKRGLRDINGNGVVCGLTEISEIQAFGKDEDGNKMPMDGQLYYRGISIRDLVEGERGRRFDFEEASLSAAVRAPAHAGAARALLRDPRGLPLPPPLLRARHHHEGALARHDEHAGALRALAVFVRPASRTTLLKRTCCGSLCS